MNERIIMNISSQIARRFVWLGLLGCITLLLVACGSGSTTNPPATSNTTPKITYGSSSLAPNPNGSVSRCLLGGRPLNIEFYGVDASNVCAKYVPVLADLGLPNLAVHANSPGGEIPSGNSIGCGLSYPLSYGNLNAYVSGYTNGDINGDAGPLAKKVCAKLLTLGWVPG